MLCAFVVENHTTSKITERVIKRSVIRLPSDLHQNEVDFRWLSLSQHASGFCLICSYKALCRAALLAAEFSF